MQLVYGTDPNQYPTIYDPKFEEFWKMLKDVECSGGKHFFFGAPLLERDKRLSYESWKEARKEAKRKQTKAL